MQNLSWSLSASDLENILSNVMSFLHLLLLVKSTPDFTAIKQYGFNGVIKDVKSRTDTRILTKEISLEFKQSEFSARNMVDIVN